MPYCPVGGPKNIKPLKGSTGRILNGSGPEWATSILKWLLVIVSVRCRALCHLWTYSMALSQRFSVPKEPLLIEFTLRRCQMSLLAVFEPRAARLHEQQQIRATEWNDSEFQICNLVWISYGKAFEDTKWPASKSKPYGPRTVFRANHPHHALTFASRKRSRTIIHARRPLCYFSRDE